VKNTLFKLKFGCVKFILKWHAMPLWHAIFIGVHMLIGLRWWKKKKFPWVQKLSIV